MTRQTLAPITHHTLTASNRSAREVVRLLAEGDLSPEYQRGSVWTNDQRIALIKSWLIGLPIPAVIINDRMNRSWPADADGFPIGEHIYGVVDGKQRIETATLWFEGNLAVPATWFPADHLAETSPTNDGEYVTFPGLTAIGQRLFANRALIPVIETQVGTIQEEAELYLLINGQGTSQLDGDIARASEVAGS